MDEGDGQMKDDNATCIFDIIHYQYFLTVYRLNNL